MNSAILTAIFGVLSFIAVITALMVIISKNPVHSVLFLILCFLHVAGLYVLLGAEFIALVQIIVYTGAILVLFTFVIMLLQIKELPEVHAVHRVQHFLAPILGLIFVLEMGLIISTGVVVGEKGQYTAEQIAHFGGNTAALGRVIYTDYLLPFEVASLLLLLAAIGAIVLARKAPDEPIVAREESEQ